MSEDFFKIFNDVLEKYDAEDNKGDIRTFVEAQLRASTVFSSENQVKETSADIIDTVDALVENNRDLREYQQNGGSRESWLRNKLDIAVAAAPDREKEDVVRCFQQSIIKANKDVYEVCFQEKLPDELAESTMDVRLDDLSGAAVVKHLNKNIQHNALIGPIVLDEVFQIPGEYRDKGLQVVSDYLEADFQSPINSHIKKVAATAAIIARGKGVTALENIANDELTILASEGINRTKLAYKVACGEIDPVDAVDELIDNATAVASHVVVRKCQTLGANVGSAIGATVGSIFGPAGTATGALVGRFVGYVAGTVVGKVIHKGIKIVTEVCKRVVRGVGEKAKEIGKKIWESIFG
jgi:hypothetical protein